MSLFFNDPSSEFDLFLLEVMICFQALFTLLLPVVLVNKGMLKKPDTESGESRSNNRPRLSVELPLISYWLMTHRAMMALCAFHIHSLFSSSHAPGEKPQQYKCWNTQKLHSRWTPMQTLIKKDVSSIAIQLCIATGSGWTETINRRDEKVKKKTFRVQFIWMVSKEWFH